MLDRVGVTTRLPDPATPSATITDGEFRYPSWLSSDGQEVWSFSSTVLRRSLNNGGTWNDVHTFEMVVRAVRETLDGELLVSVDSGVGPSEPNGELWRSSGYDRNSPSEASWTKVLTCSSLGTYVNEWTVWVDRNVEGLVLAGEYGSKADGANGRYVYRSLDHGAAWSDPIHDFAGEGKHIHGVAYDRWADRVWVTRGDSPHSSVVYSDNWQDPSPTWTVLTGDYQPVGIMPMESAVLFGPDDFGVNGPQRWRRGTDELTTTFRLTTAGGLVYIGGQWHRASEESPALLPFVTGKNDLGALIATFDGVTFHRLWVDTQNSSLLRAVGPTSDGKIVGTLSDDRQSSWSRVVWAAPDWLPATR